LPRGAVSFRGEWGKDGYMSSTPSALPDEPAGKPAPPPSPDPPVTRTKTKVVDPAVGLTRAGALWASLVMGFLVLILLLVFVTQNIESATFFFFGWKWSLPKGVAILLAAVSGGLLTFAVGTARILQLRRAAKKHAVASAD
jgi:uncharacterized integral membrane protein